MKKIEHIKIGTDQSAFDWILESERHATYAENNSSMIRHLVKRHNDMADIVNELILHGVINCAELEPPHSKQKNMALKKQKAEQLKSAGYSIREIMKIMKYKSPRSVQTLLKK